MLSMCFKSEIDLPFLYLIDYTVSNEERVVNILERQRNYSLIQL